VTYYLKFFHKGLPYYIFKNLGFFKRIKFYRYQSYYFFSYIPKNIIFRNHKNVFIYDSVDYRSIFKVNYFLKNNFFFLFNLLLFSFIWFL